jgi:hypothetical protein
MYEIEEELDWLPLGLGKYKLLVEREKGPPLECIGLQ